MYKLATKICRIVHLDWNILTSRFVQKLFFFVHITLITTFSCIGYLHYNYTYMEQVIYEKLCLKILIY